MPARPALFRCDVIVETDTATVRPIGDLDVASAAVVEARLVELRDAGCRCVRLDLRGLTFMDSSGLTLILRYDLEAKREGVALELVPGGPAVQRVFGLAGVTPLLPFVAA